MYAVTRPLVVYTCTVFAPLLFFNLLGMFHYIAIVGGRREAHANNIRRACPNRGCFHRLGKRGRVATDWKRRTAFVRKSDFARTINDERKPNDGFKSV